MNRNLIEVLRDRIVDQIQDFNEVLLWNNQIDSLSRDPENETGTERSYSFPVCFIGFEIPTEYTGTGSMVQEGDVTTTLFIVNEQYDTENEIGEPNLSVFDLKQRVFTAVQNWSDDTKGVGPFNRINEETDEDHPNLYVFKQRYNVKIRDCDKADETDTTTLSEIDLTLEPVIGDIVIRTSKGFS